MTVQVTINGKSKDVQDGIVLSELLKAMDITEESARGVAIAVNDRIVRKADWKLTTIPSGAHIEIVTARQGG